MDTRVEQEELERVRRKVVKEEKKLRHIKKRQKRIESAIRKKEKAKARKDRECFIHNLQVSNVPHLLKRKLDTVLAVPPNDELRDYVFLRMPELFFLICEYLGPSEYFMFSRTSKSLATSLALTLSSWTRLFFKNLDAKHVSRSVFELELTNVCDKIKAIEEEPNSIVTLMPLFLGYVQGKFVMLRRYDSLINVFRVYPDHMNNYAYNDRDLLPMFVQDKETGVITRASQHNILSANNRPKPLKKEAIERFKRKHGFDLAMKAEDLNVNLMRYDTLSNLCLHRLSVDITEDDTRCCGLFIVHPEENLVEDCSTSKRSRIYTFRLAMYNSPRVAFYDEYECHSTIHAYTRGKPHSFRPTYPPYQVMTAILDKAVNACKAKKIKIVV